ncbi:acetylxylan esterase [Streptomyces sp. NPDC055189]
MPLTDLSLADCRAYRPELAEPPDFDAFWSRTLNEVSAGGASPPEFTPVDTGLTQIRTYEATVGSRVCCPTCPSSATSGGVRRSRPCRRTRRSPST